MIIWIEGKTHVQLQQFIIKTGTSVENNFEVLSENDKMNSLEKTTLENKLLQAVGYRLFIATGSYTIYSPDEHFNGQPKVLLRRRRKK